MRLTIFGATGGTGRALVERALAAGHQVVAAVRTPARLAIGHPALEVAHADVFSPRSLEPLVAGSDAVLSALGPNGRKDTSRVCSAGIASILTAMDAAGVRRVVAVSAQPVLRTGAGETPLFRTVALPVVRAVFRTVYEDLERMEEALTASTADWTVLRPPMLTGKPATGRYRSAVDANVPGTMTRGDLAGAMLGVLPDPFTVRRAIGVAGPRR
ncbi:NAD(P)-dependent oxidoreductase [Nonomuraea sp. SBT364]|uniref:NAD(P)-dependent oxidoreductase n=1 Tax=Nonomuraea sp. SBT364 TaxID=1580530 RepID=UPI00066B7954|nr:NAD(P)H-binding protein [Nonomuraea sp. SBT364]